MDSSNPNYFMFSNLILAFIMVAASLCLADDAFICTRATYYGNPHCYENPSGACGYGKYGRTVNNGEVSAVSRLYRNGSGCGACYQVRCKIPTHCSDEGTEVVATNFGIGDDTDFILSTLAYANLAKPNMAAELLGYGVVDVEYRRIPCRYDDKLKIKVHEHSNFPNYLAILPIYQSGTYDITAVQIWQEDSKEWGEMRKVFGAVWDMQNSSEGVDISLRIQLTDIVNVDVRVKWAKLAGVIPSDWKAGAAYDATI